MNMKCKHLAYIEQPLKNRGDESAHRGIIRYLNEHFPELQIHIVFMGESDSDISEFKVDNPNNHYINIIQTKGAHKALITGMKLPIVWDLHPSLRKYQSVLKKCDTVMCSPGGVNMGGFQNYEHLAFLSIARRLKKPVIYYGRSVGPFLSETPYQQEFKAESLSLLKYFCYISVRDEKSARELANLGIAFSQTTDSAFLDTFSETCDIPGALLPEGQYGVIVPNVLTWHYAFSSCDHAKILKFYTSLVSRLLSSYPELNMVMLPQTFNEISYLRRDINFFKEIEREVNDSRLIVMGENIGSDMQQAIIRKACFVVGARYHSVVFAINQSTPFVALSYEHKIEGLLTLLDLQSRMVSIDADSFKDESSISMLVKECIGILGEPIPALSQATVKARQTALSKISEISSLLS